MKAFSPVVNVIEPGRALIQFGPMTITINVKKAGQGLTKLAQKCCWLAADLLEEVVQCKAIVFRDIQAIKEDDSYPEVVVRMIEAIRETKDITLTPMAAVKGAIADLLADTALGEGATRVIVDNGGDIAVRLSHPDDLVRVGVASDISSWVSERRLSQILHVTKGSGIGGVATSGLGGKGLTKGVATAATAIAGTAAYADACATLVGNATTCASNQITQCRAEELQPDTDIPGHLVTCRVGHLTEEEKTAAILNGLNKARSLPILGAVISVQQKMGMWPEGICQPLAINGTSSRPRSYTTPRP